jgi:hypothetical protein
MSGIREAENFAYRWAGSAPCEDCERFRECDDNELPECEEMWKWREAYNEGLKEFLKKI